MMDNGSVDVTGKVITQQTTHFSEWAIVASASGKVSNDAASISRNGVVSALVGATAVAAAVALL